VATNLLLQGSGTYTLTNTNNAITTLASSGSSTVNFLENSGFTIGTVNSVNGLTAMNAYLSSTGTVSTTQYVSANNLLLSGAGGIFNLTVYPTTVAADTATVNLTMTGDDPTLVVGSVNGTNGVTATNFYASNLFDMSQTHAITATNLYLGGLGAVLAHASNAITTLASNITYLNFLENSGFNIGTVNGTNGLTGATNAYLSSTGTVTQSQAITATNLLLSGAAGVYTLTNAANAVTTLAGNTGTVNYIDVNGLAIGSVNGTDGITTTGKTTVVSGGTLTLLENISATGAGTTIELSGTRFDNSAAASLSAGTGRFLVWSVDPANDDRGGLSYNFKHYNATYGVTDVSGIAGNGFLYSLAPTVTASLIGAVNKTYNGTDVATLAAGNYSVSGAVDGDTVTLNNPTSGTYDDKNVGTGKNVAVTGIAISGVTNGSATVYGYQLGNTTADANIGAITAKALTIATITADDKVYDGTTAAGVSGYTFGGAVGGDDLDMTGLAGLFGDKNVGVGKTVTISAGTLTGADKDNYTFTLGSATDTANITAKALTLATITADDKVYNGNTAGAISAYTFSGAIGGDDLSMTGIAGLFDDKNVGVGKTVTVSAGTLAGADKDNYTFTLGAATDTANITAKALTIATITADDKVYNGNTAAVVSGYTFGGAVGGDDLDMTGLAGLFGDKNVGVGKTVTISAGTLTGTDKDNYTFTLGAATDTANITAKALTLATITAGDKVYDGTTAAGVSGYTFGGAVGGDELDMTGLAGLFGDKNVGTGKTVTVSAGTLTGADKDNYTFTLGAATDTANITAKALTLATITADNKVYNGNTAATISGYTFGGAIGGDDLNMTGLAGLFGNKNVGVGKTVTVSAGTLAGADKDNYTFTLGAATDTANITARMITLGGSFTVFDRDLDGTTSATINNNSLTLINKVGGDNLFISPVAAFADAQPGTGKQVSLTMASALTGTDAGNYQLSLAGAPVAYANIGGGFPELPPEETEQVTYWLNDNTDPFPGSGPGITPDDNEEEDPISWGEEPEVLAESSYVRNPSAQGAQEAAGGGYIFKGFAPCTQEVTVGGNADRTDNSQGYQENQSGSVISVACSIE
jgi:uncharacterized protein YdeI (BOF family)